MSNELDESINYYRNYCFPPEKLSSTVFVVGPYGPSGGERVTDKFIFVAVHVRFLRTSYLDSVNFGAALLCGNGLDCLPSA